MEEHLPLGLGLTQLAGWGRSPQEVQWQQERALGNGAVLALPAPAWLHAPHLILMLYTSKCRLSLCPVGTSNPQVS